MDIRQKLEKHYKEMQDIEFTVAGRHPVHAPDPHRQADRHRRRADRRRDGQGEADRREDRRQARQPRQPRTTCSCRSSTPRRRSKPVAQGIAASPGAAVRQGASCRPRPPSRTPRSTRTSRSCWSARRPAPRTSAGMHLAKGILTSTGGKASHAAVVARGWGKPCVVGCEAIKIDEKSQTITIAGKTVKAGDFLTINGTTGDVMIGKVPTVAPTMTGDFATLMAWADKARTLKVRTNADTPGRRRQGPRVRRRGHRPVPHRAHVLRRGPRSSPCAKMILADDEEGRKKALAKLEPFQKAGLRRHLRGDGRPAGDDPPARPAAARVPAARRQGPGRGRQAARHPRREGQGAGRGAARDQPDARASAAAACRSSSPRSATCRSGRSSRPPSRSRRRARASCPRS